MNKDDLAQFLRVCTSPFHFVSYSKELLINLGFKELLESNEWAEIPTKGFVIRQNGAIIAYKYDSLESLCITTTNYETSMTYLTPKTISKNMISGYLRDLTMYQRPLKCSGYVVIRKDNNAETIQFDSGDEAISFFPIPPTLDSDQVSFNLYEKETDEPYTSILLQYLSKQLKINENDILDFHLNFIDQQGPSIFSNNIIASQNTSFLAPAFSSFQAFIQSEPKNQMNVFCAFYDKGELNPNLSPSIYDNFLDSFIERIFCLDFDKKYLEKSFCVCIENVEFDPSKDKPYNEDKIRLLINTQNKDEKETHIEQIINSVNELKSLAQQEVEFLPHKNSIKENTSIPAISLGFPILSQHSIREYCTFNSILQLYDILRALFSNNN